jgi:hypothetical protein
MDMVKLAHDLCGIEQLDKYEVKNLINRKNRLENDRKCPEMQPGVLLHIEHEIVKINDRLKKIVVAIVMVAALICPAQAGEYDEAIADLMTLEKEGYSVTVSETDENVVVHIARADGLYE